MQKAASDYRLSCFKYLQHPLQSLSLRWCSEEFSEIEETRFYKHESRYESFRIVARLDVPCCCRFGSAKRT